MYSDQRVCVFVCMSVRSHISKNTCNQNFLLMLPVDVPRSSSDENAISYALRIFWMMSYFHKDEVIRPASRCVSKTVRDSSHMGIH